ncbi:MAG: NADH-quinone oxidoreductase subunit J [Candidatus Eisenbacteria bacterium]|nr:NADH-quinone oxidoreductase subunit J [Candidatus Eisenbacteria bacterium]
MNDALFYIFAVIAAAGAVFTVTRKSPLAAALSLAVSMIGLAGLFLLLQGYLVFVLQILVYAGAVVVLIIFVIMLLNLRAEAVEHLNLSWRKAIPGVVLGGALLVILLSAVRGLPQFPAEVDAEFGTVEGVGQLLFSRFAFPFEVLSLVLLVAIVGAVVLARKGGDEE